MDRIVVADGIELHYGCALSALPEDLRARFVQLDYDADAQRFVAQSIAQPHGALKTAVYGQLRRLLSDYNAYGLLGMYAMHLLSTPQLQTLLGPRGTQSRSVLDFGAGRGDVTWQAAPLFEHVVVAEASAVMRSRLRSQGWQVVDHELTHNPLPSTLRPDAILWLNVLDRCSHPRTLLRQLRDALPPHGRLLLAVPLPLSPHVQQAGHTTDPDEPLPAPEASWEAGAVSVARVIEEAGLRVERLSRVPYLSRGDAHAPLYVLDDALFVCTLG